MELKERKQGCRVAIGCNGKRTVRIIALLIIIAFPVLVVVNAVIRSVSIAVGVGFLGAIVVVSLVVLLGAKGVVWVGGRGRRGVALVTAMP